MLIEECFLSGGNVKNTDFGYTLSLINGKFKLVIIYLLSDDIQVMRFNELQRAIGSISVKTLSATLKEMECDGLIMREEFPQIPPKVEYRLSGRGRSLIPILDLMCAWGGKNRI